MAFLPIFYPLYILNLSTYAFYCFITFSCTFFCFFGCMIYHKLPVIKIEEYAPPMIPTINGSAKSFNASTPKIYRKNTIMKVVKEVLILLVKVWLILSFTTTSKLVRAFLPFTFSRILSKITIVALME